MTNEKLYELLGDVNEKQIREAGEYRKARRIGWRGWCAAAACLCLVVVGTLMLRNGSRANHKVTFDNGDTLIFAKADHAGTEQLATDADVETRTLTASESRRIFHELPVSGDACFDREEGCFVAFEGTINDVKLVITAPGETFKDIIIEGKETISEIDGQQFVPGISSRTKTAGTKERSFIMPTSSLVSTRWMLNTLVM